MRMRLALVCVAMLFASASAEPTTRPGRIHLFASPGSPAGWSARQWNDLATPAAPQARWNVNADGILSGQGTHDTWLVSDREYGDFELELEFKVTPLGNSGVALRAPLHGDPAYDGMELQIVDPRYYEGRGAPEQLCGAIYRGIAPRVQAFKPDAWNAYDITCQGPHVKVVLNGQLIQDFNLDEQTRPLHRDSPDKPASPLKQRPRKGHLGFQDLGRDGRVQIRNVYLRELTASDAPAGNQKAAAGELDPYSPAAVAADAAADPRPVVIYTPDAPPATPRLDALPLRESISQFGIRWTFDRPAHVGQFVNGDWYVVGPVRVRAIEPGPLYGNDIPEAELDHLDRERPADQRVRNGFMLNPPAAMKVAYDSGVRNWFDPSLVQRLPVPMRPGDALVATISMPMGLKLRAPLRNVIERGVEDSSPIRTAAMLTCVSEPQPPDAFRPAFCDRGQRTYLARHLRRALLPTLARSAALPSVALYERFTRRPWVGTCFFGFEEPVENMPQYGLEYGRISGIAALLLCTDLAPRDKEPLLINYVQVGIDLGGMVRAGHPGWTAWGGHGSGRKLPIVFAGLLLGDEQLANVNRSFPRVSFGEDEQTAYGPCWTGATVVFAGHSGIDAATGVGRDRVRGQAWGPYEHTPPTEWKEGQITSESYRRCCTSIGWVAQALALRLMHAERQWDHDPFFDYVDRWMNEDDAEAVRKIRQAIGKDFSADWARQRQTWDEFVNQMWARYRPTLAAPTNGWQQPHDDHDYRSAIERSRAGEESSGKTGRQ